MTSQFSGWSGSASLQESPFLEPCQFHPCLWSPNCSSYLLQRPRVPNLILLSFDPCRISFSAGLSKRCLNMDFAQPLRDAILRPMIKQGPEGVQESVQVDDCHQCKRLMFGVTCRGRGSSVGKASWIKVPILRCD